MIFNPSISEGFFVSEILTPLYYGDGKSEIKFLENFFEI
jgi:hypothetical protein